MYRLLNLGVTDALSLAERRYVRFVNAVVGGALAFAVVYGAVLLFVPGTALIRQSVAMSAVVSILVLMLHAQRQFLLARIVLNLGFAAQVAWTAWAIPGHASARVYLLILSFGAFLTPSSYVERTLVFVCSFALFGWLEMHDGPVTAMELGQTVLLGVILYLFGVAYRRETDRSLLLLTEHQAMLEARDAAAVEQNARLTRLNQQLQVAARTNEEQAVRLAEVNTLKDRVVSVLSHDLRGPLASLDGLLEAYEQGVFSAQDVTALVPETRRTLASTREQLDDVLTWAQTLLGTANPEAVTWMAEVARRAVAQAQPRAQQKGVQVHLDAVADLAAAVEPASMLLLLRNLLANAIKFSPEGGAVHVSVAQHDGEAVVSVADSGVGISPDRLARLRDGRESAGTTLGTAGEKGSGLGLVLCREVAERFGGRLDIESEEGRGTTVRVTFPLVVGTEA